MKKIHITLTLLLLLIVLNGCSITTDSAGGSDFRNVRWGMSKNEVKEANSKDDDLDEVKEIPTKDMSGKYAIPYHYLHDNSLIYKALHFSNTDIIGNDVYDCTIYAHFGFSQGKLHSAGYELDSITAPRVFKDSEVENEFIKNVVEDMTKKYGKYKKKEDEIEGFDIRTVTYSWKTKRTSIEMTIKDNSVESDIQIYYSSNEESKKDNNDL